MGKVYPCAVCEKPSGDICEKCKLVSYCSRDCQKKDWPTHKPYCRPFKFGETPEQYSKYIENNNTGEEIFYQAKEVIPALTEILVDDPLFFLTPYSIHELTEEQKSIIIGTTKDVFYSVHDSMFEKGDTDEMKLLKLATHKARWMCYEPIMRTVWRESDIPNIAYQHQRFDVTTHELQRLSQQIKIGTPLDLFRINYHLGASNTPIYTRSVFNTIGKGIFMNAWKLTKSCAPNCAVFLSKGKLHVFTVRHVEKGEKLSIGFHPFTVTKPLKERKVILQNVFGIRDCMCPRCLDEASGNVKEYQVSETTNTLVGALITNIKLVNTSNNATDKDWESVSESMKAIVTSDYKKVVEEISHSIGLYYSLKLPLDSLCLEYMLDCDMATPILKERKQCIERIAAFSLLVLNEPKFFSDTDSEQGKISDIIYRTVSVDSMVHSFIYNIKQQYVYILKMVQSQSKNDAPIIIKKYIADLKKQWDILGKHIGFDCLDMEMFLANIDIKSWRTCINECINFE